MIFLTSLIVSSFSLGMADDLDITIVYDNNVYDENLETKWGFSCLVEGLEKTILFDVGGDGEVLLDNMEKLGIDPQKVDIVVLSHIHYDHIGGLEDFLKVNPKVTVYMPVSLPQNVKDIVGDAGGNVIEVLKPSSICKNAYTTGEFGISIKEESLVIETGKGLVIVTGCAHPGIANIIKKAKKMLDNNVYMVLGGFHLTSMNIRQIEEVIIGVREAGVEKVAPCHCSGDEARGLFQKAYGDNFIQAGCGKRIKVENAF
ncbi:MBL fold metallo-hydrolase [bacterium]|nr:MBL fold metallo-hydrolase [bacterium]